MEQASKEIIIKALDELPEGRLAKALPSPTQNPVALTSGCLWRSI